MRKTRDYLARKLNLATLVRMSCDTRTNVARLSCELKMKIRYIRGKVVRHSHDCRATISRFFFKIRPKFANLSHKCLFNETATNDWCIKLVSHWHANSSRLFREFSRGTFARHATVRVLHECRENFHVSRTSRELVAKVLNMFKNFMRFF